MNFSIVRSHPDLLKYIEHLQAQNSDALGFLPRVVFERAAEAGRVFLGLLGGEPAGYILAGSGYRGVLRCWQACIQYDARRRLYGAMLVAAVEEYGENLGCVRSEVHCASDLEANEFWASLGYRLIDTQAGGKARGRQINIWSKPLHPAVPATFWQTGRPRIYESNADRQKAYRDRLALRNAPVASTLLRNVIVARRECQNHAALIALEAAEKGGQLLKACEKSQGGEHTHRTPATVAAVSEYRQTIDAAGLSERTAERWQGAQRDPNSGRNQESQNRQG